jgi:hypothetical protein
MNNLKTYLKQFGFDAVVWKIFFAMKCDNLANSTQKQLYVHTK